MAKEITDRSGSSYVIRVKDHLETDWFTFFKGWSIDNLDNGEVLLNIPSIDQAGLHGALNRIRDLNLSLISVDKTSEVN